MAYIHLKNCSRGENIPTMNGDNNEDSPLTFIDENSLSQNIPFEIMVEILSWLPIKSLLRFKCVCKQWCFLIQDDKFKEKYHARASLVRLPYQYKVETNNTFARSITSMSFCSDENFAYISTAGGLFMEKSLTSDDFRIRNPATHQVLNLPAEEGTLIPCMEFDYDSSTGEYRVVCYCLKYEGDVADVTLKVKTIGKDDHWRELKFPVQNMFAINGKEVLGSSFGMGEDGVVHLTEIVIDEEDNVDVDVQSFDLWSECFTTNRLPRGTFNFDNEIINVGLIRWNQCEAVAEILEEVLYVMVLEDYKEHKWSENMIKVPLKFLKESPHLKDDIFPVAASFGILELQSLIGKVVIQYDMKREIITRIKSLGSKEIYPIKPSLVSIEGMTPEYKGSDEMLQE